MDALKSVMGLTFALMLAFLPTVVAVDRRIFIPNLIVFVIAMVNVWVAALVWLALLFTAIAITENSHLPR